MQDIHNPFADCGHPVYGPRFIGRRGYLDRIETRVLRSPGANLGIIGQRRVGKSSLAYQAVMARRNELLQQRILPVSVSVSTSETAQRFFCDLAGICHRQLEDLGLANRFIREAANEVKGRDVGQFNFVMLKEFFEHTQNADIRIILILDEFDAAARFFATDRSFFDRLRDLSQFGQTTLLTISRNPVFVIEKMANISSTLVGTIDNMNLGLFGEHEINDHFDRLMKIGVVLRPEERRQIIERCGGHPFLHDNIAFELVELFRHNGQVDVDKAFQQSEDVFLREFYCIVEHLRERGLLEPLTQALFDSPTGIGSKDLKEIKNYGLIQPIGSSYKAFSTFFQEYLTKEQPMQNDVLSPAELRVLPYLKGEMSNKEIANELNLSSHTIKTHIANIVRKLQVSTRHEAVRRARDLEIIE